MKKFLAIITICISSTLFCQADEDPVAMSSAPRSDDYRSQGGGNRDQDDGYSQDQDSYQERYRKDGPLREQRGYRDSSSRREMRQRGEREGSREKNFPRYDRKNEEKIEGDVVEVVTRHIPRYSWDEVAIIVRTDKGTFPVVLGPSWFVDEEAGILYPGEHVDVIGSVFQENGKVYMIAREIKTDNYKLELRDSQGFRKWCGWSKS